MAANSDVGIELKARTDEFEAKLKRAIGSFESLAIKGRDVSKSIDTSFRGISTVAKESVNKIEQSFNSLSIKSDFSLNIQKEALALNVKFFERQYNKIAADARSSAADVERAFTAMNDKVRQLNEQPMKSNFSTLGIMPTSQIEAEKAKITRAFEEIKNAGIYSSKEISRAHEAMRAEMNRLDGAVKKNTEGFNLMGLASVGAILKIQVLYSLVNTVMSAIGSAPGLMMNSVESFRSASIANAAIITSMQKGTAEVGERYKENKIYAEAVQEVLIKMDAQTAASGQNLTDMNRKFVEQGVLIDTNNKKQVEGMLNVANALAALTAGDANANLQYSQEISALLRGENRPSNKLFQLLNGMDNGKLKEHLDLWRKVSQETGNYGLVLEKIGPMLSGFAAAQGDINALWSTVKSTMTTIRDDVLRNGFAPEFDIIVGKMKEISEYAVANKDSIVKGMKEMFEITNMVLSNIWQNLKSIKEALDPIISAIVYLKELGILQKGFAVQQAVTSYAFSNAGVKMGEKFGGWYGNYIKDVIEATVQTKTLHGTLSAMMDGLFNSSNKQTGLDGIGMMSSSHSMSGSRIMSPSYISGGNNVSVPKNIVVAGKEDSLESLRSAENKRLELIKASEEAQAAVLRAGIQKRLELSQNEYNWGKTDLETYLEEKHRLTQEDLHIEVQAKQRELEAFMSASPMKGKDASEDSRNASDLAIKRANAEKALTEAQAKLTKQVITDNAESINLTYELTNKYKEQEATFLDMQGKYVDAAKVRNDLEATNRDNMQMIQNAFAGNQEAMDAYWAKEETRYKNINDAIQKQIDLDNQLAIGKLNMQASAIDSAEKYDGLAATDAAKQRIELLNQELVLRKAKYESIMATTELEKVAKQEALDSMNAVIEKMKEQQAVISDRSAMGGLIKGFRDYTKEATDLGGHIASAVQNSMNGMTDALVNFVNTGKLNFNDLANSIMNDLIRIAMQEIIVGKLAAAIGTGMNSWFNSGSGATSMETGYTTSSAMNGFSFEANGNAFSGISGMSNSVVSSPTVFKHSGLTAFASGAGVMGEAGPEAVMPLKRTSSGKLGVQVIDGIKSAAQGTMQIIMNVVNKSDTPIKASSSQPQFDGKQYVINTILENVHQGGTLRGLFAGSR